MGSLAFRKATQRKKLGIKQKLAVEIRMKPCYFYITEIREGEMSIESEQNYLGVSRI